VNKYFLFFSLGFVSALIPFPAQTYAQTCGGTERWAVKVGTDTDATLIDPASGVPATIHEMVGLPAPQLPPGNDDKTRLPIERKVVIVQGRLVQFQHETGKTGDDDYHLVITDDTLDFTPGGSGKPHGHGLVAEIPNPDCVAGEQGDPAVPSHFAQQLRDMRAKFDQQFPHITGGWNEAGGLPVRITGVQFFDRQHGQVGRALNTVEIHPIFNIEFGDSGGTPALTITPASGAAVVADFQNPGFEDGTTGWTTSSGVITAKKGEPARTGHGRAWLGGHGTKHTDTLFQEFSIPASATAATLSFYLHISTEEQGTQPLDTLQISARSTQGVVLKNFATFSNLQAAPGYHLKTVDLSVFHGKTIRIFFQANEDNGSMTSFVLDDFSLVIEK
jgi:hypothetical protein